MSASEETSDRVLKEKNATLLREEILVPEPRTTKSYAMPEMRI